MRMLDFGLSVAPSNRFTRHRLATAMLLAAVLCVAADFTLGAIKLPTVEGYRHPYYHHDLTKNFSGRLPHGNASYVMKTNALGFKDRVQGRQVDLTTPKHRIVFIGDSFTEGQGLPYEQSFVGTIDAAVDHGRDDILNAGVTSYAPRLYFLKTQYLLDHVGLQFDELWVFLDISDAYDELFYQEFAPRTSWRAWLMDVDNVLEQRSLLYRLRLSPFLHRRDAVQAEYSELDQWTERDDLWRKWGARAVAFEQASLDDLLRVCRAHGVTMHLAVYPWPRQVRAGNLESRQVTIWRQFAAARGVDFLDLFPLLVGRAPAEDTIRRYYFNKDPHWNAAGHALVAEQWLRHRAQARTE